MRADIHPGATFPDYELPDQDDAMRSLSELQGDDPMILVLSRGRFCPKEQRQHRDLVDFKPRIDVAYTKIVTISTDDPDEATEMRWETGADWPFLADTERVIQKDLEIQEATDPYHDPMVPHTLVLGPGLEIHSIYCGYYFWGRPSPDELWHDLREVFKQTKPDFDPTTPVAA
ncbi:MAG: redoxin domain-containing protein [Solirubrobacterales bacterium]|nr:redoxin domain-containing protein [Solirubrobacterales bacterium]